MPPSVHKILIHGPSVIKESILPVGQLSEEVLEASHKVCKKFRQRHARKMSRVATNEDVFMRWLLYSDPKISLSGDIPTKSKKSLPIAVLSLLQDSSEYSPEKESSDSDENEL